MSEKAKAPKVSAKSGSGAVNNVEVGDFDVAPLTREEIEKIQRDYTRKLNKNSIELSASVVERISSTPNPIHDKDGNPVVDDITGEIKHYPITYSVKLAFNGGEKEISVSEQWFNELKMSGERYMFVGRLGMVRKYGKESIDTIFTSYTEI